MDRVSPTAMPSLVDAVDPDTVGCVTLRQEPIRTDSEAETNEPTLKNDVSESELPRVRLSEVEIEFIMKTFPWTDATALTTNEPEVDRLAVAVQESPMLSLSCIAHGPRQESELPIDTNDLTLRADATETSFAMVCESSIVTD